MEFEILPLHADTRSDFFTFFGEVQKNDSHNVCMCTCWNMTDEENRCEIEAPVVRGKKSLRAATKEAAEKLIDQGRLRGYLAYASGAPVGWCNANDKICYPHLITSEPSMAGHVKCIMCFEVVPDYRNRGVASELLQYACADAKREGYVYAEAYPNKHNTVSEDDYAHLIHIYKAAGFRLEHRNDQDIWVKKL
ncbi:MAG: GNAT family N-acetyltransferase [Eubacteriales bacterium]